MSDGEACGLEAARPFRPPAVQARSWALFGEIVGDGGRARSRGIELADEIETYITASRLNGGDRLGTERELSRQFAASSRIMRQASRTLLARGAVEARRGKAGGYVVAPGDEARALEAFVGALPGGDARRQATEALEALAPGLEHERGTAATFARAVLVRLATDERPPPAPHCAVRAESIAARIEADLDFWLSGAQGGGAGVLDAMSEHYAASLPVVVQAIRLLEDGGVLWLRKGRRGGILASADRSAGAVRAAHAYFASRAVSVDACDRMVRLVNIALIDRAIRTPAAPTDRVDEAWGCMRGAPDATAVGLQWYALQREISDLAANAPLHLLARCFAAYVVRWRTSRADLTDGQARTLAQASGEIVGNIHTGRGGGSAAAHHLCQEALRFSW
jgi:DNA-binding FadR family transcriptional regulator